MARPLRIEIENGLYHVTSRGWERCAIVKDDEDRREWMKLLDRVAIRCGWRFFAWALMDNHFHLFLRTPNADLSAGMHDLNSGYATWFNRRHQRVGSLFQGRFKAILVEDESYAWTLSRYIHLNPVRAGIVKRPQHHAWSSYRYFLQSRGVPDWLDWRTVLDEMGKNRSRTRQAYRRFVELGLSTEIPSPLEQVVGKVLLGSQQWVEKMRQQLGHDEVDGNIADLREVVWRPTKEAIEAEVAADFGVDLPLILSKRVRNNDARMAALYLIRQLTNEPATQLASRYGGVSQAAISKSVKRAELRMDDDVKWRRRLNRLTKSLRSPP